MNSSIPLWFATIIATHIGAESLKARERMRDLHESGAGRARLREQTLDEVRSASALFAAGRLSAVWVKFAGDVKEFFALLQYSRTPGLI